MGTHQNRLDAKGRVSVPAPFRAIVAKSANGGSGGLILRPSHRHPCIEGWTAAGFQMLAAPLEKLELFSEERDALETALYSNTFPAETDREGRIVLPDLLVRFAALADAVTFLGRGRYFHIWEPAAAQQFSATAFDRARTQGLTLPGSNGREA